MISALLKFQITFPITKSGRITHISSTIVIILPIYNIINNFSFNNNYNNKTFETNKIIKNKNKSKYKNQNHIINKTNNNNGNNSNINDNINHNNNININNSNFNSNNNIIDNKSNINNINNINNTNNNNSNIKNNNNNININLNNNNKYKNTNKTNNNNNTDENTIRDDNSNNIINYIDTNSNYIYKINNSLKLDTDETINKIDHNNNKNIFSKNNNRRLISNYSENINNFNNNNINNNNKYNVNKRKYNNNNKITNKKPKLNDAQTESSSYKDIFNNPYKNEWLKAVYNELNNMKILNIYQTVKQIPKSANLVSCRWIFKNRTDANGTIIKRKARLVAKGFTQQYGIDFHETFSPTLKQDSIRILTALAVQYNYNIEQMDINAAYLNANLDVEIYMIPPECHEDYNKRFWKLNKAIYGLKQRGHSWNNELNKYLINIGFRRLISEPCLYMKTNDKGNISCLLGVYVDDNLISGTNYEIKNTKILIKNRFKIKEIGNVDFVIGIKFIKHDKGYFLNQKRYILDIIKKFGMELCYPIRNMKPTENKELRKIKFNPTKYRSAIGNLLYLAICTRPDILFSVSKSARKSTEPTMEDWENVLKIFKYLKGTINYGINFTKNNKIEAFVDADYAGDKETRKSTTGFIITIGNTSISSCSKLQRSVSTSSAESEYYSLRECGKHCAWYLNLFNELNQNLKCISINIDNKAAIYNSKNQTINPRTKHIDIRVHYIRELIKENKIYLKYIKSEHNLADGFTKYLNSTLMDKFRNSILYDSNELNF